MKYEIYIKESKKPEDFYIRAMEEYKKRLSGDCKVRYHFIRRDKEWERLLAQEADEKNLLIRVTAGKADLTSEQFADRIGEWERMALRSLVFLISPQGEEEADYGTLERESRLALSREGKSVNLCLSCFSMPVSMSAMILLEQIYRGYRIRNNQPYHK